MESPWMSHSNLSFAFEYYQIVVIVVTFKAAPIFLSNDFEFPSASLRFVDLSNCWDIYWLWWQGSSFRLDSAPLQCAWRRRSWSLTSRRSNYISETGCTFSWCFPCSCIHLTAGREETCQCFKWKATTDVLKNETSKSAGVQKCPSQWMILRTSYEDLQNYYHRNFLTNSVFNISFEK